MSQFVLPSGFELVTFFTWDALAAGMRGVGRALDVQAVAPRSCVSTSAASTARAIELASIEEDVERWDGLS